MQTPQRGPQTDGNSQIRSLQMQFARLVCANVEVVSKGAASWARAATQTQEIAQISRPIVVVATVLEVDSGALVSTGAAVNLDSLGGLKMIHSSCGVPGPLMCHMKSLRKAPSFV